MDQAIHLPREAMSVGAINKGLVKSTDSENDKPQQVIEPLCFLLGTRGIKIPANLKWVEKLKDIMHVKCPAPHQPALRTPWVWLSVPSLM